MSRWIRFLIAILVGFGVGLLYGWVINPIDYIDTTPDTLRIDYKTDYVLMVAEAYHNEGDTILATQRLAALGELPLSDLVYRSILFAQRQGYTELDISRMQNLLAALKENELLRESPAP